MNLSDINITLFAYFYKKTDFDFESEAYDEDVIFCVAEGKFSYWINDGQKHIAEKGDAIICPKGTVLGRKMNSPTTFCMIKFKQFETLTYKKILLPYDSFSRLLQNIKSISNYGICLDVSGNPILHHYCRDIFLIVNKYYLLPDTKSPIEEQYIYITNHATEEITVANLAKDSGYTPCHFISLFKQYYAVKPKDYIISLRMNKARYLLQSTKLSVNEISAECGYKDELYFSRIFKKNCGTSPTAYRKITEL